METNLFFFSFIKELILYRTSINADRSLKNRCLPPLLTGIKVSTIIFLLLLVNTVEASRQTENLPWQIKKEISLGVSYGTSSILAEGLVRSTAAPLVDIVFERDRFFASLSRGIGYGIFRSQQFKIDAALGYRAGRSDDKDALYRGLGDVKGAFLTLISLDYYPSEALYLYASASRAINSPKGVSLIMGTGLGFPVAKRLYGYIDVSSVWADGHYVQTYYGITPRQSKRSAYEIYTPEAGFFNIMGIAGVTYEASTKWAINFAGGATRLKGGVHGSPLVAGERVQTVAHIYATHRF